MASAIPKEIRASLYIDGKPAEQSIKAVSQVTRTLERELNNLTIGTEAFNKKLAEVAANKKYLKEIKDEVNGVGGAFGQLKQELGKVGTLAAGYLGFQFITSQFQGIITGNAKLSDSLADVRRVTGLTEAGVLDLDRSLGKLDTRTSKSGLRDIAIVAGKLGVAKGEILSFVEATDKLTVALGDELGDANALTTQLGKILNVFEGSVNGDNISRLGNAMVGLANDGVASGAFIAQYTQLISGIAKTAGVSLPATLALGAGLEELGGRAESSATATQKLLISITQNKDAYKIAGVSLSSFNKMLAEAPEKALLLYAKGLTANKAAFAEVTAGLKDAGEEGARTIELITKLGQNTEFFNDKIAKTGKLYQETGQITDAYNLKNQTLGAQVDKLGKDFNGLASNTTLVNFLTNLVQWASASVIWLKENSVAIGQFIKVIIVGTTAWLGYKSALMLTSTWTALTSGYMAAQRTVALLLALAQATLSGNTARAAAAQRALGLSMVVSPLGAVLAVVSALAAAYVLFSQKVTTAALIQEDFNSIKSKAQLTFLEEKTNIQNLVSAINNENASRAQKLVAINKLRDIMPSYLKQYSDEDILAGKAITAINKYVAALESKSLAEAAQAQIKKLQEENISLGSNDGSTRDGFLGGINEGFQALYGAVGYTSGVKRLRENNKADNNLQIARNNARIKEIQGNYGSLIFQQTVTPETPGTGGTDVTGGKDKKVESAAEKKRKQEIAEAEKIRDGLGKIQQEIYLNTMTAYDKEEYLLNEKYANMLTNTKLSAADVEEIKRLQEAEVLELQKKYEAIALKELDENAKKRMAIEWQIFEATATSTELEIAQAKKKYDELIALARANSFDTIALEEAKAAAIERINNKAAGNKTPQEAAEEAKKAKQDEFDFYFDQAQNVSNAIFEIGANARRAETNAKLKALDQQKNAELANKDLTDQQRAEIEARYAAKIKEEKLRAWKADQKAAIAQVVINGAVAVTKALAQVGPLGAFVIPSIVAGTLLQTGIILSQQPPEYAEGGMSDENPSGYVSKATIFNKSASGRPFVAGEKGKEWIAPNWMLNNPRYANMIGMLEVARKEKRMYASGGFNSDSPGSTSPTAPMIYDFARLEAMITASIAEQRRFNSLPIVNVYADKEAYERTLAYNRSQQMA